MQPFGVKILLFGFLVTLVSLAGYVLYRYSTPARQKGDLIIESSCFSSTARLVYENPTNVKTVYINGEKTNELEIIWEEESTKEYIAYVEWNDGTTFQTTKIAEKPKDCAEVPIPTPTQFPSLDVLGTNTSPTISLSPTKLPTSIVSPTKFVTNTKTPTMTLSPTVTLTPFMTSTPTSTPTISPTKTIVPTTLTPTKPQTITPTPTLIATASGQVKGEKEELPSTGVSAQSVIFLVAMGLFGLILYRKFKLI